MGRGQRSTHDRWRQILVASVVEQSWEELRSDPPSRGELAEKAKLRAPGGAEAGSGASLHGSGSAGRKRGHLRGRSVWFPGGQTGVGHDHRRVVEGKYLLAYAFSRGKARAGELLSFRGVQVGCPRLSYTLSARPRCVRPWWTKWPSRNSSWPSPPPGLLILFEGWFEELEEGIILLRRRHGPFDAMGLARKSAFPCVGSPFASPSPSASALACPCSRSPSFPGPWTDLPAPAA